MMSIAVLFILSASALLYLGIRPSTRQFIGNGTDHPDRSIAELKEIELGGMNQWVLIRGADKSNPVLLWLHGGPGAAQMPLAHHLDRMLEEEFVVVHWDQRGAGKSNHRHFDEETMSVGQYIADARELIAYLQEFLDQQQIILLGHSWGTQFGLQLAHDHPELITGYIGVSQVTDNERANEISYAWLEQEAEVRRDQETLKEIGPPPYSHGEYREFARLVDAYGGNFDMEMRELIPIALRAPEYTAADYLRMLQGMMRGGGPLHGSDRMIRISYLEEIREVEFPAFFISGDGDYNTPVKLVREFYQQLSAPMKGLLIMEGAAHTPFLKDPEAFSRMVIDIKGEILQHQ